MMRSAPTGLVTLVFTDVQASTVLWDRAPRAMKRALLLHDQVMRAGIERFKGYEVKTEGDAFMVAFQDPLDALRWCLETQEALHETDWPAELETEAAVAALYGATKAEGFRGLRVRMGIHRGQPECRENSRGDMDYFGSDVNRAARLCDAGHGGQVLLSASTWAAVADAGIGRSLDLGEHILRGFHGAEPIVQVLPEALSIREFPPLRGVEEAMPEWPDSSAKEREGGAGEEEASWAEAPLAAGPQSARLAVYCGDQFPIEAIRRLAVKHDLQLVRLMALDSVQAEDVLVVDGSQDAQATLSALRDLDPVWRHCYWVSFHEPSPPLVGVERLSPLDVAVSLEEELFGTEPEPLVTLEEPAEDPPWLDEHRPAPEGFRFNLSAFAVAAILAALPAFCVMTVESPLDVELPAIVDDGAREDGTSMNGARGAARGKARPSDRAKIDNKLKQAKGRKGRGQPGKEAQAGVAPQDQSGATKRPPVILFKTSYCPACRAVACLFDRQGIPYSPLDLDEDEGAQAAFPKALVEPGGTITVPVVKIGERLIQGYKRTEILRTLSRAGYPIRDLGSGQGEVSRNSACKGIKMKELENWKRPKYSVLNATPTPAAKRRAKQPMPFDTSPMSACLDKLGKRGKKGLKRAKKLSVTLRLGIMGDGRIVAVSVKKMAFGRRGYKRRKVASCIEGAVVGQTFPLRPEREPEFVTKTYRIP